MGGDGGPALSVAWQALALTPASGLACPQRRRAQLEGAVALFGFYGLYGELQSWLTKQTTLLQTLQPEANNLEVTQLKYEVRCC